jgi:hypothetical protein
MRNKREVETGEVSLHTNGSDKQGGTHVSASKNTPRNKTHDNAGETFVRFITSIDDQVVTVKNGRTINPFTDKTWNTKVSSNTVLDTDMLFEPDTVADTDNFTKFHLEDGEMLIELMIHLQADCPDLMQDKAKLIEQVSRLHDLLRQ